MPIFNVEMASLDGTAKERIEITGTKMPNFTTIKRPDMNELKREIEHGQTVLHAAGSQVPNTSYS